VAYKILALQNANGETLGILEDIIVDEGFNYRYVKIFKGEKIPSLDNYRGILILGGPMGVYDDKKYPFLKEEISIIKEAFLQGKPLLGICLGCQLIAKAFGAKVYAGHKKEIGWYRVRLTKEGQKDFLFRSFHQSFPVFQWHGDTFDLPKKAIRLATSTLYKNQAFKVGNIYALQFHLEMTDEMINAWSDKSGIRVRGLSKTSEHLTYIKESSTDFFTKWLSLMF